MVNLNTMNLIPGKTKGKTRVGDVAILMATDGAYSSMMPFHWYLPRASGRHASTFYTTPQGKYSAHEIESPGDIVEVSQPWTPRAGDQVIVNGPILAFSGVGIVVKTVIVSGGIKIIDSLDNENPGYYNLRAIPGDRYAYSVHRSNFKRVR